MALTSASPPPALVSVTCVLPGIETFRLTKDQISRRRRRRLRITRRADRNDERAGRTTRIAHTRRVRLKHEPAHARSIAPVIERDLYLVLTALSAVKGFEPETLSRGCLNRSAPSSSERSPGRHPKSSGSCSPLPSKSR